MTEDQQEAESRKYSNQIIMFLVLDNLKIAIFGPNRKLYKIVKDWGAFEVALWSPEFMQWQVEQSADLSRRPEDIVDVDVGDLGL